MESGRLISSAVPFRAPGGNGGQVLLFGGGAFRGGAPMATDGAEKERRKRPFLAAHDYELQLELGLDVNNVVDQLCGSEYELQGTTEKTKRRLTAEQVQALEVSFEEEKRRLEPERKSELARRLGIAPRQVAVWFQNRRARWRAKQLEQDFDRLRAAHDELLAGRDALVADNDRLRSQVITLTEKLQAKDSPAASSPPEEQTTAPSAITNDTTATATAMQAAVLFVQLDEDQLGETSDGALPTRGGFSGEDIISDDSPDESYCFAAGAPSPPQSSSEGDCRGGDENESSALLLPDAAMLLAEEDSWEWFWN